MADKYKGITLTIEGDSTPLQKALKEPQAEARTLESNLKKVNNMLKFDPNNTQLLEQKQRLLGETVAKNKEKLALLKQAQQEFIKSGGDITGTEYINLQQEIQRTEQTLNNLTAKQKTFADVCDLMGQGLQSIGDGLTAASEKTKFLTDTVKNVGSASVDAWKEMDKAWDTIAAGTGATGDNLEKLKDNFDNVYSNFPEESGKVAAALADISTRFGFLGKDLETATEDFLKFSRVNGVDVQTAIAKVSRAMGDAGIASKDYASVLDKLTAASQASGATVDHLAESLTKYGAPLRNLGMDTEHALALFAQWEKAGVNTEIAFSGMKKAIGAWAKEGKDANVEFENVLKSIQDAPDLAKASEIAIEAFGQKAGPDLADAIKGGRFSVSEMMEVVKNAGGQMNASFEEMTDQFDDLQVAMNGVKTAGAELASAALEILGPILQEVLGYVKQAVEYFKNLDPATQNMLVKVGLIAAAISPILGILGTIFTKLGSFIAFLPGLTSKISSLWATLSANPIIWIVGIIALLVAAFTHLWNTNDQFKENMIGSWNKLKEAFQEFAQGITDRLAEFGLSWSDVINALMTYWNMLCDFLAPIFEGAWKMIVDVLSGFFDIILGLVDFFTGLFTGDWDKCWQGIKSILSGILKIIVGAVKNWVTQITGIFSNILKWLGTSWEEVWQIIKNTVTRICTNIVNSISNFKNNVVNTFINIINSIKNLFSNLVSNAWTWGRDMIQGFIDGITGMIGSLVNSVKGVAERVANFLHFSVPDEGPLSDFDESGGDMIDLFIQGMEKKKTALEQAVQGVAQTLAGAQDFNQTLTQNSTQNITIPVQLNLDGKTITKNVVQRITKDNRSLRLSKGVS